MDKLRESKGGWASARRMTVGRAQERHKATRREHWVIDKLALIDRLREDAGMGHYDAQMLIAGSILNALAAEVWPGRYKDRQRFVQLLATYANPALGTKAISIPLLKRFLMAKGWSAQAHAVETHWPDTVSSGCMRGIGRDAEECELMAACANVPIAFLRRFSYANVLYDEVQLGRVRTPAFSHDIPGTEVGYTRMAGDSQWAICFGIDWLRAVVTSTEELSRAVKAERTFATWWLS